MGISLGDSDYRVDIVRDASPHGRHPVYRFDLHLKGIGMKRVIVVVVLSLALVAPACSNGGCMCPGNGKNPACQGC